MYPKRHWRRQSRRDYAGHVRRTQSNQPKTENYLLSVRQERKESTVVVQTILHVGLRRRSPWEVFSTSTTRRNRGSRTAILTARLSEKKPVHPRVGNDGQGYGKSELRKYVQTAESTRQVEEHVWFEKRARNRSVSTAVAAFAEADPQMEETV